MALFLIAALAPYAATLLIAAEPKSEESPYLPAERRSGILSTEGNVPRLDPIIADRSSPFFPSRASTGGKKLTTDSFLDSDSCKECHVEIYEQWSQSTMGHAWEDPIYRAILERASIATDGAVDNFCIGCHSPIGLTTGTVSAVGPDGADCTNVSCEACHSISAITGTGNGSFVLTPVREGRPIRYGPRGDALSPFHDTTYSELHTKSEFCSACHNVTHPFNRLPVERTYDEWRDSPYNAEGISCQDCHMSDGPGVTQNPGKSAPEGKERPHVFSHRFTGANVTLHEYFGDHEMADRARRMLESAATIQFLGTPLIGKPGRNLTVRIQVDNVGAGHKLPTGFPEGREVWVDFQVRDKTGKEIYRLGAIRDGHTEEGTKSFKVVLGDSKGNVVDLNVWEADRVLSDTRILPKGNAQVEFMFLVPEDAEGPLSIIADLNYMSFPQYILDELFGKDGIKSVITRMASVKLKVNLRPRSER